MKASICVLDNAIKFPSDDQSGLKFRAGAIATADILIYSLNKEEWQDTNLRNFMENILKDETYIVSAFENHEFFLKYRKKEIFSPDIIVFDWDIPGYTFEDTEQKLYEILTETSAVIAIFTESDKKREISILLEKPNYNKYSHRTFVIDKLSEKSAENLKTRLEERKGHLHLTHGFMLRRNMDIALSQVLSDLGAISYEQFISIFGSQNGEKSSIPENEYLEIILEKFKSVLLDGASNASITVDHESHDETMLRKIYNFRMYQPQSDDVIRKGDIVKKTTDPDKLFLVFSSDCHMNEFWRKNLGHLALIPIYRISNSVLKDRLNRFQKDKLDAYKITSVTNSASIPAISVLPGVFCEEKDGIVEYFDGVLSPKEIESVYIDAPKDKSGRALKNVFVKYSDWENVNAKRIKLVEPFLSGINSYILSQITGWGVPDYSESLQELFAKEIGNIKNK